MNKAMNFAEELLNRHTKTASLVCTEMKLDSFKMIYSRKKMKQESLNALFFSQCTWSLNLLVQNLAATTPFIQLWIKLLDCSIIPFKSPCSFGIYCRIVGVWNLATSNGLLSKSSVLLYSPSPHLVPIVNLLERKIIDHFLWYIYTILHHYNWF